jgi:AcrR family transcriptional regulator
VPTPAPATGQAGSSAAKPASPDGAASATRRLVIDAAVASILERGFYRASSNEIARRAGVTWGVIQHHFGTREKLMLAVLQDGARRFAEIFEDVEITGATVSERLGELLEVLARHYGTPEYLAYMQVMLNMDHDPRTSAEVRTTMRAVAERANEDVRRLLRETLGPATKVPDLATTIFLTLRGFTLSQQLLDTMAYDAVAPETDRVARQRRLLTEVLAPYIEQVGSSGTR